MKIKISLKKTQFLVNIAFLIMLLLWFVFDVFNLVASPFTPGNHVVPEGFGMFGLGLLFGSKKELQKMWQLILIWLFLSVVVGILLFNALFVVLGINLFLLSAFLLGYFLEKNRKIIKVEKA